MGKITDETKKRKVKFIRTIRTRHVFTIIQFLMISFLVYQELLKYPEIINLFK